MISIDTETHLITPQRQSPKLVCMSTSDETGTSLFDAKDAVVLFDAVMDAEGGYPSVFHNSAFDLRVMVAAGCSIRSIFDALEADLIHDTMIREKLLDNADGQLSGYANISGKLVKRTYSLAALTRKYVGTTLDKDTWRLRYSELDGIPLDQWPAEAVHYAKTDALSTLQVYQAQEKRRERQITQYGSDPLDDEGRQVRRLFALSLMSAWGIKTDPKMTTKLEEETEKEYYATAKRLSEVGLSTPEGRRNTKAAKARMIAACEENGNPLPQTAKAEKLAKEGADFDPHDYVALDRDSCERSGDPALLEYADLTSLRTVLSKDVKALRLGNQTPIHTRINSILETGRPSSSAPNIFNIRALPGIRECFVPRKGRLFLQADYSGLELATLAQVCLEIVGHSKLAETINRYGSAGRAHTEFAVRGLGVSEDSPGFYEARQTAKVANFGFPGGLGIKSLVYFARAKYGVTLTENQAKKLKNDWLQMWPEMREYFALISRKTENGKAQIKQLYSGRLRGGCSYTQGCNTYFQGLGADATGLALYEIQRQCYDASLNSPLFGARMVNYVYDEFILEVPDDLDIANVMAETLVFVGEKKANQFLPDVPVRMGDPVLMRYWSKKAEPLKDDQGRLIPWG